MAQREAMVARARALFHTQHLQLRRWEMSGKNEALDARAGKLKRSRSGGSSFDDLAGCKAWDARGVSAKQRARLNTRSCLAFGGLEG